MKRIVETLLEEGIDESMIHRILDLIEEEYTLYTGAAPEEKEFKVKTTHDNGSFITKVKAKDAQTAHKLVAKMHGGPDSAHKVVEECEVVDENIKDYSKKKLNQTIDKYYVEKDPIKSIELEDQWDKDSDLADKAGKIYDKSREDASTHELTKNDSGKIHTDIRRKDALQGTWARRREDEKAGFPKATKKSVRRHYHK